MSIQSVLLIRVSSTVDKGVDHPQFFDPPYALKSIQAMIEKQRGSTAKLIDCWINPMPVEDLVRETAAASPDLVVISSSSFDVGVADELAGKLKQLTRPPLIIGVGQGYYLHTELSQEAKPGYDAVLLGEPEEEFMKLFAELSGNGDDGAWRQRYRAAFAEGKRFTVENPDGLPFASYTPAELEAYKSIFPVQLPQKVVWGYLIATRGCPYDCTFCSEVMRVSIGKKLRGRSPANIADEMEHLARQGVNICSFQDDSFTSNKKLVQALCEELIARGSKMPWMCRGRVDEVAYDSLSLMKRAGLVMIGFGVESGSERMVKSMIKQYKDKDWQQLCRQAFRWTRELGIGTNAYYIIGSPTETRAEIESTIELALGLNSDTIQVHFYTPYPGSSDWKKYKDEIDRSEAANMFHYAVPKFNPAAVSSDELVELRSRFYRRYIFRPRFVIDHFWKHASFYWHNPDIFWTLVGIRKVVHA